MIRKLWFESIISSHWFKINAHKSIGHLLEVLFHPALLLLDWNSHMKHSVMNCLCLGFSCGVAEPPSLQKAE